MIDILVTTYNRIGFLRETLETLCSMNSEIPYRLFVVDDCSTDGTQDYLLRLKNKNQMEIYLNAERRGLAFNLNFVWRASRFFDDFFGENPYLCYLQDDMRSVGEEWLLKAVSAYEEMGEKFNVGFFSAYHSPEHPIVTEINHEGRDILIKKSNSGKNIIARKSFWQSVGYIPRNNPDGSSRGMPNDGRGSEVDIWLEGCYSGSKHHPTHCSPNCSYNQGKNILVVPGLLEHMGEDKKKSTWQANRDSRIRP